MQAGAVVGVALARAQMYRGFAALVQLVELSSRTETRSKFKAMGKLNGTATVMAWYFSQDNSAACGPGMESQVAGAGTANADLGRAQV